VIVLDTNIVSVLMTPDHPDAAIIEAWLLTSGQQDLCTTAVTQAEILYGLAYLPDGARKRRMTEAAEQFFVNAVTLSFDAQAARHYATLVSRRRTQGRPIGVLDAQIAAIALAAGGTVATRNVRDFADCGVPVVNPYEP